MSKLHHHSKRYEVQRYIEHTMSWRPVYHTNVLQEAKGYISAFLKGKTRILDRVNGSKKANPISE